MRSALTRVQSSVLVLGLLGACGDDPAATNNTTGPAIGQDVDYNGDGMPDGKAVDTNGDNVADALDTNGDNIADLTLTGGPLNTGVGDGDGDGDQSVNPDAGNTPAVGTDCTGVGGTCTTADNKNGYRACNNGYWVGECTALPDFSDASVPEGDAGPAGGCPSGFECSASLAQILSLVGAPAGFSACAMPGATTPPACTTAGMACTEGGLNGMCQDASFFGKLCLQFCKLP